jgi:MscS family membrane protein
MRQPLQRLALMLLLSLGLSVMTGLPASAQSTPDADWSGNWQSFWATGEAFLVLEQQENTVFGTYQPGNGRLSGSSRDGVLRGTWQDGREQGDFIFVMSHDGQTFSGRYGAGDYWNGHRDTAKVRLRPEYWNADTPQATLRTIVTAGNDAQYHGREGQVRFVDALLSYDGPATNTSDRDRRRRALWHILDMSTFRLWDAPVPPAEATPGDVLHFDIAPAGVSAVYQLRFVMEDNAEWRLTVPPNVALQVDLARLLDARGHKTLESLEMARAASPRMVMMNFILGSKDWTGEGDLRALRSLDLDHVPRQLRHSEGALLTDYLKQTIDRIGYIVWQELPDDPNRPLPYTYYKHPLGDITLAPTDVVAEDGSLLERRWRFSRKTMEVIPTLHAALDRMPLAPGLTQVPPLSQFFATRQAVLSRADGLRVTVLGMEMWQWIGLAGYLALMAATVGLLASFARRLDQRKTAPAVIAAGLMMPLGLMAVALLFLDGSERLGLTLRAFGMVSALSAMLLILAGAVLGYRLLSLVFGALMERALKTDAFTDEIVLSLAQGLLKLMIVVTAVIACADVAGLPYEGVLTGLGIGGVALAFAARETVSNILGGAILLSDRPFKKGDLIEAGGALAVIETVGLRSTRLRKLDDTLMIVPNAQLSDQIISNWGNRRKRQIHMVIGLAFETPRDKLETFVARLMSTYKAQETTDAENITIGIKALGPHSIDIELWGHFHVRTYKAQIAAQQALILDILSLAEEVGVTIAYPTQTLHLTNAPAAPEGAEEGSATTSKGAGRDTKTATASPRLPPESPTT